MKRENWIMQNGLEQICGVQFEIFEHNLSVNSSVHIFFLNDGTISFRKLHIPGNCAHPVSNPE